MGSGARDETSSQREKALGLEPPLTIFRKEGKKKKNGGLYEVRRKSERKTGLGKQNEKLRETKNEFNLLKDDIPSITAN